MDEAALRRLTRRIYLPLPDEEARKALIKSHLDKGNKVEMSDEDIETVTKKTHGYSSADVVILVKEAAMCLIREVPTE